MIQDRISDEQSLSWEHVPSRTRVLTILGCLHPSPRGKFQGCGPSVLLSGRVVHEATLSQAVDLWRTTCRNTSNIGSFGSEEIGLIRSELCALVGMSVAEFNAALSASDLPFEAHLSGEMRDEQGRVRSNFTLDHATLLLATRQLVSAGLSWSEAAAILREPRVPTPRISGTAGGSYCVARAEFLREGGGEPRFGSRFTVYGGPLPDIVVTTETEVKRYNQHHARTAYEKIALTSLVATDLTRARRVASARAEELGLAPQQSLRVDPDADVTGLESKNLDKFTPSRTG